MQPYTHLAVGLVLAQAIYPRDFQSWLLVVSASLVIDVPPVSEFLVTKLEKKEFKGGREPFLTLGKISHSLLLWLISVISWPIFIGAYSHLILDLISHKERVGWPKLGWIWPLPWKLRLSFFDYRGPMAKAYSWPDLGITFSCLILFVLLKFC